MLGSAKPPPNLQLQSTVITQKACVGRLCSYSEYHLWYRNLQFGAALRAEVVAR
jgi:hypothetical protein